MGWNPLKDVGDWLFKPDDTGIKAQQQANEATLDFVKQQQAQARGDVTTLQPYMDSTLQHGYGNAMDLLGGMAQSQVQSSRSGNRKAQEQLLAGLPQMQNSILGLPINNAALQPAQVNTGDLSWLYNPQMPDFGLPDDYGALLGGPKSDLAGTPVGTTNSEIVALAKNSGLIDENEYGWLQKYMKEGGHGNSIYWSSTGNASPLVQGLGDTNLTEGNKASLEKIFYMLYPPGSTA